MKKGIIFELTPDQVEALQPLAIAATKSEERFMIIAQVFVRFSERPSRDGIDGATVGARLLIDADANAVIAALEPVLALFPQLEPDEIVEFHHDISPV